MCPCETRVPIRRLFSLVVVNALVLAASAQTWTRIAGTTIDRHLAGPASGPVWNVWYSAAGDRLLVQTPAGRIFETGDFEHWRLNSTDSAPAAQAFGTAAALPEPGARVQTSPARLYAAGRANVYASEDGGHTWLNLTGFNSQSVIGDGFAALAISPAHPEEIAAVNQFGVWRSLDGGLSWQSLNQNLPNLMVRKLINRRTALLADDSLIGYDSGSWIPVSASEPEAILKERLARNGVTVSAAAQSGAVVYAGTADGRLLASRDNGSTWSAPSRVASAPVERIWVSADRPESALAAAGSRLFRTVNSGLFWDDVTGSMPAARIHGIAADVSAGVVYVATERGVFSGDVSLNDAGPSASSWKPISRDLPAAIAWDVRLNSDNTLTVALDGYGIFETSAPHRTRAVRVVNGADMSDRAAAPGSLISVLGANVKKGLSGKVSWPVIAASDQSSQLQVPFDAGAGNSIVVLDGARDSWSVPVSIKDASPAIFVDAEGAPLILDAASGLVVDPKVAVRAGSLVEVLATGLGKVTPDWPAGVPAPLDGVPSVRGTVTAFLDGTPVQVARATLAPGYVGYYIVELQIPSIVNRGTSELRIVMNGEESNRVKLYLEPDLALQ
jgi:uncharacterized protein (TIGR03437 family)